MWPTGTPQSFIYSVHISYKQIFHQGRPDLEPSSAVLIELVNPLLIISSFLLMTLCNSFLFLPVKLCYFCFLLQML